MSGTGEGICLTHMIIEQKGIFIVPHMFEHGTLVFAVSSGGLFRFVTSYVRQSSDTEVVFQPDAPRLDVVSMNTIILIRMFDNDGRFGGVFWSFCHYHLRS